MILPPQKYESEIEGSTLICSLIFMVTAYHLASPLISSPIWYSSCQVCLEYSLIMMGQVVVLTLFTILRQLRSSVLALWSTFTYPRSWLMRAWSWRYWPILWKMFTKMRVEAIRNLAGKWRMVLRVEPQSYQSSCTADGCFYYCYCIKYVIIISDQEQFSQEFLLKYGRNKGVLNIVQFIKSNSYCSLITFQGHTSTPFRRISPLPPFTIRIKPCRALNIKPIITQLFHRDSTIQTSLVITQWKYTNPIVR